MAARWLAGTLPVCQRCVTIATAPSERWPAVSGASTVSVRTAIKRADRPGRGWDQVHMFEIRKNEDGTVVLEGRLDAAQEEKARVVLDGLEDTTVLDCKDLSYIASAGLGILLRA